jgi:hypothetical protein
MGEPMDYEVLREVAGSCLESAGASLDAACDALKHLVETKRLPSGESLGELRHLAIEIQKRTDWLTGCLCV